MMGFVCEIAVRGDQALTGTVLRWSEGGPSTTWSMLPRLSALDIYTPVEDDVRDPYNKDSHGPLILILLAFANVEALAGALAGQAIAAELATLPKGASATATALERRFYPVRGETMPGPLLAPISYVVRYHRPAEDERAFIANYVESHPATQAGLPAIRSIICYFPLDPINRQTTFAADYLIGNEVAFDTVAAFNAAMASPTREELRAHFRTFPPFTGANTHYLMARRRIEPRG